MSTEEAAIRRLWYGVPSVTGQVVTILCDEIDRLRRERTDLQNTLEDLRHERDDRCGEMHAHG